MMKRVLGLCISLCLALGTPCYAGSETIPAQNTHIIIHLPSRTLALYDGTTLVQKFKVGVGKPQFPTPTGRFTIINTVKNPTWENPYESPGRVKIKPGKDNPLGTRWMGFHLYKGGVYGIHGTNNPQSVGQQSSHGCVRMTIAEAEYLYERIGIGTPVEVTNHPTPPWQNQPLKNLQQEPSMVSESY
jgi:lipoprotein-anchoring transpeptidase ErfK/SrfK